MGFVLHIVPDSLGNPKKPFVGSTKDVRGRTEYFEERGIAYHEYLSVGRSDSEALEHLQGTDLSDCDAVLFEYETYIDSLAWLKAERPRVRRIVRAHNANLPHMLDNFTGRLRMGEPDKGLEDVRNGLFRYRQDCACAELADVLLPITGWEAQHYWGPIAQGARVVAAPYFLPRSFALPERVEKRNLCVCFMGTGGGMTPLLYDAGRNTVELANATAETLPEWEFAITGALKPADVLGPLGRVKPTGLLPSPFPILMEAKVVTILSGLGMGFKTKILEAIMAGCWVMVTPDVFARLPEVVRPWCKTARPESVEDFQSAISACAEPPPAGDPNAALRAAAFEALDTALS